MEIQIMVKSAHFMAAHRSLKPNEDYRHLVGFTVESTMTISTLKSRLKRYHWIPRKNLVIVSEDGKTQFSDDNATPNECGVKNGDTLLAGMEDGSFRFDICSVVQSEKLRVRIHSCFQTIGELKKEIYKLKGYDPEVQVLTRYSSNAPLMDGTPLVALGIVKPYMKEMRVGRPRIKLVGPVSGQEKGGGETLS